MILIFIKSYKIINVHNPVTYQDSGVKPLNKLIAKKQENYYKFYRGKFPVPIKSKS